jgi:hypothetical protein
VKLVHLVCFITKKLLYSKFPSHWYYNIVHAEGKGLYVYKGKANPAQASTGPEVSSNLKLPEFLHSRHLKVVSLSVLNNGRLNPQEIALILISVRGWVDPKDTERPKGLYP